MHPRLIEISNSKFADNTIRGAMSEPPLSSASASQPQEPAPLRSPTHTNWQAQAESMTSYKGDVFISLYCNIPVIAPAIQLYSTTPSMHVHAVPTQDPKEPEIYAPSRTLDAWSQEDWRRYATHRTRPSVFGRIAHPNGRWPAVWDGLMTLWDLTYTAFVAPVSIAFSSVDHIDGLVGVDIAASALYIADVVINFTIGFVVRTFDGHQVGGSNEYIKMCTSN